MQLKLFVLPIKNLAAAEAASRLEQIRELIRRPNGSSAVAPIEGACAVECREPAGIRSAVREEMPLLGLVESNSLPIRIVGVVIHMADGRPKICTPGGMLHSHDRDAVVRARAFRCQPNRDPTLLPDADIH
jgi:hypothetical protein